MSNGPILTPLSIAVLALLSERSMHPYEMYQTLIQRSEDRIVKVRPGSLYHTVERLFRDGLVRPIGTERDGNRPERTTYEITEPGQLALSERVSELIGTPINEYPEFPVAIGEAHNLPPETVAQLLRNRLRHLHADLALIQDGLDEVRAKNLPREFYLDAEYIRAVTAVEAEWVHGIVADLESGALVWNAGEPASTDAGPALTDAGPGSSDAGPRLTDAGRAPSGAGPGSTDAGRAPSDAGPGSTDAGRAPSDAGPGSTDAGRAPSGAGPASTDAGPAARPGAHPPRA